MKKKEKGPGIRGKVAEVLDIPREVTEDVCKVTIIGENEILIENYKGVLEYDEGLVRVKTVGRVIKIWGEKLEISTITDDDISVRGRVDGFEFMR